MYKPSDNYQYSSVGLTVSRTEHHSNEVNYLGGKFDNTVTPFIKFKAKPGIYTITVYTNWKSFLDEVNLSLYGPFTIT